MLARVQSQDSCVAGVVVYLDPRRECAPASPFDISWTVPLRTSTNHRPPKRQPTGAMNNWRGIHANICRRYINVDLSQIHSTLDLVLLQKLIPYLYHTCTWSPSNETSCSFHHTHISCIAFLSLTHTHKECRMITFSSSSSSCSSRYSPSVSLPLVPTATQTPLHQT